MGIEKDIATELVGLGDLEDPVGVAFDADVDVLIATDEGVDSRDELVG